MSPQSENRTDSTANTPRARTRHGCWTCRKRRRKCDEHKPKCQNCVVKGLKCQYGLQLTFHEANHFKLMPDEARALSDQTPGRYQCVQFVDGMEDVQEEQERDLREDQARQSDTFQMSSPRVDSQPDHVRDMSHALDVISPGNNNTFEAQFRLPQGTGYNATQTGFGTHNLGDALSQEISPSHTDYFPAPRTPRHGLSSRAEERSMGHTYSSPFSPALFPDGERGQPYESRLPPISSSSFQGPQSSSRGRANLAAHPTTSISEHSPTTARQLTKHFIDKVAPWLDLTNADSTFGTHMLIISSKFFPLRNAILALSEAQSGKFQSITGGDTNEYVSQMLGSDMYSRRAEAIAARSLLEIAHLLSHPLRNWKSLLGPHVSYLNDMGVHGFRQDSQRLTAWLTLRFDLATAISSQSPILINLALWQPSLPESPLSAHSALRTTSRQEDALLLCAKIADLTFSQDTETHPAAEIWSSLYTSFQNTRDIRQSESLIPILSSQIGSISISKTTPTPPNESIPSEFPLQIHTSRVSFYSSFLYHLTSILLLMSRPTNIDRSMNSKLKTTTWHAVQISGLSMSNNILWSWDPVVVTALLYTGQSLSYKAQQMELLRHLRRLEETTAWKFGSEVDQLEDFWRSSS